MELNQPDRVCLLNLYYNWVSLSHTKVCIIVYMPSSIDENDWGVLLFLITYQGPVSVGYREYPKSGRAIPFRVGYLQSQFVFISHGPHFLL